MALVTADADFGCLAGVMDVYMPLSKAQECANYDSSID
jgi:hypothetical protein